MSTTQPNNQHPITKSDIDNIQDSLSKASAALSTPGCIESVVGNLTNANEELTRLLRMAVAIAGSSSQPVVDSPLIKRNDSAPLPEELRTILGVPISDLVLEMRAQTMVRRVEVLELRDGYPVRIRSSISSIGELVQLTEADLLEVKKFGKVSLNAVREKLRSIKLDLGMEISDEDLRMSGVPRVRGPGVLIHSGAVEEYQDGAFFLKKNSSSRAIEVLSLQISSRSEITLDARRALTRLLIVAESGETSPLRTIGQLVQISADSLARVFPFPERLSYDQNDLLNLLLPHGLYLGMRMQPEELARLGVDKVSSVKARG